MAGPIQVGYFVIPNAGEPLLDNARAAVGLGAGAEGLLRGPVNQWVEQLTDLASGAGFDTFVLWQTTIGQAGQADPDLSDSSTRLRPLSGKAVEEERKAD